MTTTPNEDQRFGTEFLDDIVNWIGAHLKPDDVFDLDNLKDWAEGRGWIIDGDQWALEHGYVLKDE